MQRMQGTARLRLRTHRRLPEQRSPHQMQRVPHALLQFRNGQKDERGPGQLQADDDSPSQEISQDLPVRSFHCECLSAAFAAYLQRGRYRASRTYPVRAIVLDHIGHRLLRLQQHACFLIAPLRDHDLRIVRSYLMVVRNSILVLTGYQ